MKKLIYITLFAIGTLVGTANVMANTINNADDNFSNKEYEVLFRVDHLNMNAYVVFYGPATRGGDNVQVNIISTVNGSILLQEFFHAEGNGQVEQFSIDGLEPGVYTIEIIGDKYNKNQLFLIPS